MRAGRALLLMSADGALHVFWPESELRPPSPEASEAARYSVVIEDDWWHQPLTRLFSLNPDRHDDPPSVYCWTHGGLFMPWEPGPPVPVGTTGPFPTPLNAMLLEEMPTC